MSDFRGVSQIATRPLYGLSASTLAQEQIPVNVRHDTE